MFGQCRALAELSGGQMEGDSIGGDLLDNLAALGVAPTDIDTVLFSHLHPDHVGWVADAGGEPVFPNTVNVLTEQELAFKLTRPGTVVAGGHFPAPAFRRLLDTTPREFGPLED
jgi:glyoxylase-like metal-dependent hydrolase (beta-lactamase superfamily II)